MTPAGSISWPTGRIVRATLPGTDPVALGALPGATEVECAGDRVTIHTKDSDAIARHLLTQTAARDGAEAIRRG